MRESKRDMVKRVRAMDDTTFNTELVQQRRAYCQANPLNRPDTLTEVGDWTYLRALDNEDRRRTRAAGID